MSGKIGREVLELPKYVTFFDCALHNQVKLD
jgi:hypothetical protein